MTGSASRASWTALLLLALGSGCFDTLDPDAFDVPPVEARDSAEDGVADGEGTAETVVDADDADGEGTAEAESEVGDTDVPDDADAEGGDG